MNPQAKMLWRERTALRIMYWLAHYLFADIPENLKEEFGSIGHQIKFAGRDIASHDE